MGTDANTLESLGLLPFAQQIQVIDEWIEAGQELSALLMALGEFPDHEPLAYAVRGLVVGEHLGGGEISSTLGALLRSLPETGVQRLLKGVDRAGLAGASLEVLRAQVEATLRHAGVERLGASCLMDRWLKNAAPSRREGLAEAARAAVLAAIRADGAALGELDDNLLIRLPGRCFGELEIVAIERGVAAAWRARVARFCADVLGHLQKAPRSLSQANAEEILARRVYTDPGHFIVELLQNAEDCAAHTFDLTLGERSASVWHDGAPFDARDVVGVLSIGQTTKSKEQIGFFGVGFKAIYEICERPRVHSEWFDFEIADISIPRRLAPRPRDDQHPDGGTLLVLPYRDRLDGARAPARLYERALAVPPETMLTLSNLTSFRVRHGETSREVVRRREGDGRVVLDVTRTGGGGSGESWLYQVAWSRFTYDGEGREVGRSLESDVMVALALDAQGRPRRFPTTSPRIYSHLPTAERSGLEFLVHAHFELPVDRERLNLNSPWNRWALRCAGTLLPRVVEALLDDHGVAAGAPSAAGLFEALWDVLPLPEELTHSAYAALFEVAQAGLGDLPMLPGADGRALAPRGALWIDNPELSEALAEVVWPDGRRACRPFEGGAGAGRARRGALAYGALELSPEALVEVIARDSGGEGVPWPEKWLREGVGVTLSALGEALVGDGRGRLEGGGRAGGRLKRAMEPAEGGSLSSESLHRDEGDAEWVSRLKPLAWIPDQEGLPRCAASVRWASPELRALVGDTRPLIAPALEANPSAGQRRILSRLGIVRYDWSDFMADLAVSARAEAIYGHAGAAGVLKALSRRPMRETRGLAVHPLFPDDAGVLRALDADCKERVWLTPAGEGLGDALARWLRSLTRSEGGSNELHAATVAPDEAPRAHRGEVAAADAASSSWSPSLMSQDVSSSLRPWLTMMGAVTLDLGELTRLVGDGAWSLGDDSLKALHTVLADHAQNLSPRDAARLASAPLFEDVHGCRRPMSGLGCVWMPVDEGVVSLAPGAPWLALSLLGQPHIARMPSLMVGPQEVVEALCGEDRGRWGELAELSSPETLQRVYEYLHRHAAALGRDAKQRLSEAPIWRGRCGSRWGLGELRRRPTEPDLAVLHEALSDAPVIDEGGEVSALSLAERLGLGEVPHRPDHLALVKSLAAQGGASLMEGELREALARSLGRAAELLSAEALTELRGAPLFLCEDGVRRPVGDWSGDDERAHLVAPSVRAALSRGPRLLMVERDQRDFSVLWEALNIPVAGLEQLIVEAERVGLEELHHDDGAVGERLSAQDLRRTLRGHHAALDALPDAWKLRASSLPMWPVMGGGWGAALELVRPAALRQSLGEGWEAGLVGVTGLLCDSVEDEAAALREVLSFRPPAALIKRWVEVTARPGEPLEAQVGLLSHCEGLHRVLAWCVNEEGEEVLQTLPLSVNALGELCRGVVHVATEEERSMCQGLPLLRALAWRPWAPKAAALAPSLVSPLPPERLLTAIARAASEAAGEGDAARPAVLGTEWGRARFARWVMSKSALIESEPRLLGALGNAPVIQTAAGSFKAPRDLLLGVEGLMDEALFEDGAREVLGLDDWRCSDEVPRVMRRWLRDVYRLESRSLKRLVEILASAHREAQAAGDGARSAALLGVMGSAMREGLPDDAAVSEMARRHRVHRLRVEDDAGVFEKMTQLFCPTLQQRHLLGEILDVLPRCVSARYDAPEVRWLMRLAGAPYRLEDQQLKALMEGGEGLRDGVSAKIALARYTASALAEDGGLRGRLKLDTLAWVPDGLGDLKAPGDLYWPDSDLSALIGESKSLYPHSDWLHTAPEVVERLPFRSSRDARVLDVVEHLRAEVGVTLPGAPLAVLAWFERGLKAGSLSAADVAMALKGQRLFADDQGVLRAPEELIVEDGREWVGDTLHAWGEGRRFKALSAALSVSQSVGPAQIIAYHQHLAEVLSERDAKTMLRLEPGLEERLNQGLLLMVARRAAPWRGLLVVVRDMSASLEVVEVGDPRFALPVPAMLRAVARDAQVPVLVPAAPLSDAASRWLAGAGSPTLDSMLSLSPLPERPGVDISAAHADGVERVRSWLARIATALPTGAAERWRRVGSGENADDRRGWTIRVAESLSLHGRLVGREVSFEVDAAIDEPRGRLWVTPRGLRDARRLLAPVLLMLGVSPLDEFVEALAPVLEGKALELPHEELAKLKGRSEGRGEVRARVQEVERAAQLEPERAQGARRASSSSAEGGGRTSTEASSTERGRGEGRWWSRVQKWFGGEPRSDEAERDEAELGEVDEGPARAVKGHGRAGVGDAGDAGVGSERRPFEASDHSRFFQPARSVNPQLHAAHGWLGDRGREPEYGFSFSPPRLDYWHRYAPKVMAAKFQPSTQRWLPVSLDSDWSRAGRRGVARVSLSGRVPRGQSAFPAPMYARLVSVSEPVRLLKGRGGAAYLKAQAPTTLTGELVLDEPPRFEGFEGLSLSAPSALLEHTVPSGELPAEALELVEGLRADGEPLMVRALAVRDFIRERYRYDPAYMEDPAVARWLQRVTRDRPNVHIAALHAGADARHLGAGVCYELGALACELLRRAGVPALVATGWTWDRGQVADADHMWSMALLPSDLGARWLPVDASTTREGRPLHVGDRPRASWNVPPPGGASALPDDPVWSRNSSRWDRGQGARSGSRVDGGRRARLGSPPRAGGGGARSSGAVKGRPGAGAPEKRRAGRKALPLSEMMRVVRHLRRVAGEPQSDDELERRCREVLSKPAQARRLLAWLDGEAEE